MSDHEVVRAAVRHATYPGRVELAGQPLVGPTAFGEPMAAVEAVYNPKTDSTRVGFAIATQPDVEEFMRSQGYHDLSFFQLFNPALAGVVR